MTKLLSCALKRMGKCFMGYNGFFLEFIGLREILST